MVKYAEFRINKQIVIGNCDFIVFIVRIAIILSIVLIVLSIVMVQPSCRVNNNIYTGSFLLLIIG
jgi:hypothetical protein